MQLIAELLRADDLLALRVWADNLKLDVSNASAPALVRVDPAQSAFLIYEFQPQSIFEQAFFETSTIGAPPGQRPDPNTPPGSVGDTLLPPGQVAARITHTSRIAFSIPNGIDAIPYTTEALLDWSKLTPSVVPVAQRGAKNPQIVEPSPDETSIELPYRLILSPDDKQEWTHSIDTVTHDDRTELWHTQLKTPACLRAVWSPDFRPLPAPLPLATDESPFRGAMKARDRAEIVILTSAFSGYITEQRQPFVPRPIVADQFVLSTLGGWLRSQGHWEPPHTDPNTPGAQFLELSEWNHVATQARDHYVRIVYEGHLFPFGHRAALVKVTERKVQTVPSGSATGSPCAYMRQRMYIVVREPEKIFSDNEYQFSGRAMPLRKSIRLTTVVTPNIDDPSAAPQRIPGTSYSFWVYVSGAPFQFHCVATDVTGRTSDFTAALIFVPISEVPGSGYAATIRQHYKNDLDPSSNPARKCTAFAQKVAYANPVTAASDDTSLTTNALYFDVQDFGGDDNTFAYLPTLDQADVTIPQVQQLLGTNAPATISLFSDYIINGMDSNAGVFASLASKLPLQFSADKAGGIATPNFAINGISAKAGPVAGDLAKAAIGKMDPNEFFGDLTAQLFGTINVKDLISAVGGLADLGPNGPHLTTQFQPDPNNPQQIVTALHWTPQVQGVSPLLEVNNNGRTSALTIDGTMTKLINPPGPDAGTFEITGTLTNFKLVLVVIGLNFSSFTFTAGTKKKTNVAVHLDDSGGSAVEFLGPLQFVNKLSDIIPKNGFGDGPHVDITPAQATVGYTLGLPPVGIGVFDLENIVIDSSLTLPFFDGKPHFDFYFAKRDHPFLLTVELLGGGGFLHVEVDATGPIMIEGQLEFGGNFSLDIGVASGGVHVMAGIYFKLTAGDTQLSGFVDLGGEVEVLGIVSVSVDFNLSLTYDSATKKITGRATLTVSISVLFFSASVQMSVERSYGNGSNDPSVKDVMSATDWGNYAAAFAA